MARRPDSVRMTCTGVFAAALLAMAATPVGATDRQPFRVGMIARDGDRPVVDGLSAIKSAMSLVIGIPVEVIVARDYPALVQAQIDGRVDYAVYSAGAYAAASLRCGCVRAVVAPVDGNGAFGVRSVLFMRETVPVEDGGSAPSIAVGPPDSLAGRLAPDAGLPAENLETMAAGFVEAGSLALAERMFLEREVDGFFGWTLAFGGEGAPPAGGSVARLRQAGLGPQDYRIDWVSAPLRYGPHAVRADLDEGVVKRLVSFMTGPVSRDEDLAAAFAPHHHRGALVAVSHEEYAAVIDAVAGLVATPPGR